MFSLEGVNRHLTKHRLPDRDFARRLDRMFGDQDWLTEFYIENPQADMFEAAQAYLKDADFEKIVSFLKNKLAGSFYRVAENHLILRNTKNTPLFLLCFAAANEKGASTAVKIANNILRY